MDTIAISLPFTLNLTQKELNWFAIQELKKHVPHWAITETSDGCESYSPNNGEVACMIEQGIEVPKSRRFTAHNVKYTGLHTVYINEVI